MHVASKCYGFRHHPNPHLTAEMMLNGDRQQDLECDWVFWHEVEEWIPDREYKIEMVYESEQVCKIAVESVERKQQSRDWK